MPITIFCCYAHEDEALLNQFKSHLRPMQRQGQIDVWHDREISAGTEWEREITKHLNAAQIILLLVSPDFMDSDYCYSIEMERAVERHERGEAHVIPVILRPILWWETPFGKLQALPTDSKPVTTWANIDEAFLNVAEGIREVVEKLPRSQAEETRRNLLQFFQQQVPDAMKTLRGLEDEHTKAYSEDERTKKYIEAVYEPRNHLSTVFADFVQSDSRCFVVVGDSGSGKSCWACDTALRYLQSHHTVLFYRSVDIEKGIFQAIRTDLNWAFSPHYDEVQAMKRLLEVLRQDHILVFIDGLDEIPLELAIKTTDEFLKRADGQRMKLIATCKSTVWKDLLEHDGHPTRLSNEAFTVEGSKGYRLRDFDEHEFLHVIEKYRAFNQYFGGFEAEAYEHCRHDPFLLRVMFEVASKHRLPNISYTAVDFFREYFLQLCRRFESSQRSRIQYILTETAQCLYTHNSDEIDEAKLKAHLGLSLADPLPTRLFELNILEPHDRDDIRYISFYFKKLRDYLIAFRALKWQTLSAQAFKSEIEKGEISGIRLEVLNLYYSVASSEEHKRVLDGQLYTNASAFLSLYEKILDTDFPALKQSFPPNTSGQIGFVGYVDFSHHTISMHGFRPLKPGDAMVLLLPAVRLPDRRMRENKGYLAGSLRMQSTGSSRGFQNIDIVGEVFSQNISPSLNKIIQQGKLDESQNKELLIERVLATCVIHCQDYFEKYRQDIPSSYLPLCLKELKEYLLYKIAQVVLDLQYRDRKIASGQLPSVVLSAQEQAEIEEQARTSAKQGKNMAHERERLRINDGALLSLLEDIDNLKQLHIVEITSTPLTVWYDKYRGGIPRLQGPELFTEINQLVESLYLSFLNEYQILVARNFPTLCHNFEYYSYLPAKFSVALDTAHYDPNPQINPLAMLGILVQQHRENREGRNAVVLSTSEAIYAERHRRSVDPAFSGPICFETIASSILSPDRSYTSFKAKNSLCILRNMVYQQIEEDIKAVLAALIAKYRA